VVARVIRAGAAPISFPHARALDNGSAPRFGRCCRMGLPRSGPRSSRGTPWLDVFCPGCGTSRAIDLRKVDRHPPALVATLVLGLRCSWRPESAPMPRILGLHALPPAAKAATSNM
jgi:hypothetical protein